MSNFFFFFVGSSNQYFSIGISPTDKTVIIKCEVSDNNKTCRIIYGPQKSLINCTGDLANADDNWLTEMVQIDIGESYEISLNSTSVCIIISAVSDIVTVTAAGSLDLDSIKSFTRTDSMAVNEMEGIRNFSLVIICSSSSSVVFILTCTMTACLVFVIMQRRKQWLHPPSKRSSNIYE